MKVRDLADQAALLQNQLNFALDEKEKVNLRLGYDFEERAGAVIYLNRDAGVRQLINLARRGADEVGLLFLPRRDAWVTMSISRSSNLVINKDELGRAAV